MKTFEFTHEQTMLLFQLLSELSENHVSYLVDLLPKLLKNQNDSVNMDEPFLIATKPISMRDVVNLAKKYGSLITNTTNTLVEKTVLEATSVDMAGELISRFGGNLVFNVQGGCRFLCPHFSGKGKISNYTEDNLFIYYSYEYFRFHFPKKMCRLQKNRGVSL